MKNKIILKKGLKTKIELEAREKLEKVFIRCPDKVKTKLENFPKYIRRQDLARIMAFYEIFKKNLANQRVNCRMRCLSGIRTYGLGKF